MGKARGSSRTLQECNEARRMPWPKIRATLEESPGRPGDSRAHDCPARVYHLLAKEAGIKRRPKEVMDAVTRP